MRLVLLPLLVACGVVTSSNHVQVGIRSGSVKSRGVNIGGWLLAEHWMTSDEGIWKGLSSNVTGRGEYAVMQALGPFEGNARFTRHWDTFITEYDIQQIATAAKLNTIRVPVGYWIQGCGHLTGAMWEHCNMYPKGGLPYLDKLIRRWAKTHNVAVLVSVHGAPGSQNGQDHSGAISKDILWAKYNENVRATREFAAFLVDRYQNDVAFLGLGLLNEPVSGLSNSTGFSNSTSGVDFATMSQYYRDVVADVRAISPDVLVVTAPLLDKQYPGKEEACMQAFEPAITHAWHDWHPYVIWGNENQSERELVEAAAARTRDVAAWTGRPLLLGEWSLVTPGGSFSDTSSPLFQQFVSAYLGMLKQAKGGWTYWSWKKSSDDVSTTQVDKWSLRSMLNLANSLQQSEDEDNAMVIVGSDGHGLHLPNTPVQQGWRLVNDPAWIAENGRAPEWWYNRRTQTLRTNRFDGLCLTAVDSNQGMQAQGAICDGAASRQQQWQLEDHRIILAGHTPRRCLSSNLTLSSCVHRDRTQYFNIGREQVVIRRTRTPHVAFGATEGGAALSQPNQTQWIVDHGQRTVQNVATGKCLDAFQNRDAGVVHVLDCSDDNVNQKWVYDAATSQLRHATHVGYCLDVCATNSTARGGFHLSECHDETDANIANQQFDLVGAAVQSAVPKVS